MTCINYTPIDNNAARVYACFISSLENMLCNTRFPLSEKCYLYQQKDASSCLHWLCLSQSRGWVASCCKLLVKSLLSRSSADEVTTDLPFVSSPLFTLKNTACMDVTLCTSSWTFRRNICLNPHGLSVRQFSNQQIVGRKQRKTGLSLQWIPRAGPKV